MIKRGYSLTGKTAILHIVILGSSPNISIKRLEKLNLVEQNSEDVLVISSNLISSTNGYMYKNIYYYFKSC